MQIIDPNNIKIYNLSSGKSIPEWLSDRKKRQLLKKNVEYRRRIELLQDFEMPAASTSIRLSPNGHYILAAGIYKPRVRCYDVDNLGMKFERCFDSEVISFEILSEDFSKLVFLQCDRYIEFHSAEGRYYRLRMPKFGHDMKYNHHTCDLYLVGASSDIYKLNLEKGQYQTSFNSSQSSEINKVTVSPLHGLILTGSLEGKVEAWDPRSNSCIGTLDCALSCLLNTGNTKQFPSITALNFNGNLTCGVGMSTGQVLLYDIRMNRPFKIKDHMYELPIKDVEFLGDHIISMDSSIVKIWNKETGNLFTSIDAGTNTLFNNLCLVPRSGMFFIANENVKIQTYYIPTLGPAPQWCGFLDALIEELEESKSETVYDDYKFVTEKQLEKLGLSHLIGTDLLRAYMHGYFMDVRLYRKAKSAIEPFDFEQYKKQKIKEKLNQEKKDRIQIQKELPNINKLLAKKLQEEKNKNRKKSKGNADLLTDERFKSLFENADFEIDINSEEYRLLNPVLNRLEERKENVEQLISNKFSDFEVQDLDSELNSDSSSDESSNDGSDENCQSLIPELKRPHKKTKLKNILSKKNCDLQNNVLEQKFNKTKFYELKSDQELSILHNTEKLKYLDNESIPLGERLKKECNESVESLAHGNKSFSFTTLEGQKEQKRLLQLEKHRKERKRLIRPAPKSKKKSKF